jgi:signal transduction histidine kinase
VARGIACVPPPNLFRTTAFRLTLLYVALFTASVAAILGFIYWSTVEVIDRQTTATIEAEIKGLAEQYKERGLAGLVEVIRERADERGDSVYLLADPALGPLAGNLTAWPPSATAPSEWVSLDLVRRDGSGPVRHEVRARTFRLTGNYRLLVGRDMHEKAKFRNIVVETLTWSLAATLVLGLLGGVLLSRGMLARVDGVTQTARRIMQGDLSRRIRERGSGDEFDRLAESLNAMFEQIERLMSGMRLATDSLAHDLRGPLTRLRGRIELALIQPPESARDRQALVDVLSQADWALAMFDSLLKIAAAESGVAATELKPLDLAALARDAAELYEPVAEERGLEIEVATADGPLINAQRELLSQAVANLLDNAVKHTPAGGHIIVRVAAAGAEVVLTVADTGPGILEGDRARVLERFVRLEECRHGPGAGLGLSLVAAVAKLHGATLRLEDNAPGLKVELRFPVARRNATVPKSLAAQ